MAKKKNKKTNVNPLLIVILLIIIGVVVYFGYDNYIEVNESYNKIDEIIESMDSKIDKEVRSNIDLQTLVDSNNTIISWNSSNTNIVSNTGVVSRPTYLEGDQTITLTATYSLQFKDKISQMIYDILGLSTKKSSYVVKVIALDATAEEALSTVLDSIYVPDDVFASLTLPTSSVLFDDVSISWNSNKESILSSNGTVNTPPNDTEVELTATATMKSATQTKQYKVNVLKEMPLIEEIDLDFNDSSISNKYSTFTDKNVSITNGMVKEIEGQQTDDEIADFSERYLKLRTTVDSKSFFNTNVISKVKSFSFDYKFSGEQTTEKSSFKIYTSNNGIDWEEKVSFTITHKDEYQTYTLSSISGDIAIKVEHISGWKTDTSVDVDNIKVYRDVSMSDLEENVSSKIITSVKKSIVLPVTTLYGGMVTYESNNIEVLDNNGKLLMRLDNSTIVIYTITIQFNGEDHKFQIEINVSGTKEVIPVEIYFIDLGKYGTSDCGESIYIKYDKYDILIDAGDSFDSTKKAVYEGIDKFLDDGVLDYVIATHPDSDHIGGMPAVFEKYDVANLVVFDGEHTTQKYQNFKNAYTDEGCNVFNIYDDIIQSSSNVISLSGEVFLEFYDTGYLNADVYKAGDDSSNGRSIVFTLNAYETRVLLTGDADSQSTHKDLETNYQDKVGDIDILKAVHHGTKEGTSTEFLEAVKPEVVIICNGNYLGNKHSHPHVDTIGRLYAYSASIKVYATTGGGLDAEITSNGGFKGSSNDSNVDRNGSILLIINGDSYNFTSENYGSSLKNLKDTTFYQNYLALS